jgi:transposase
LSASEVALRRTPRHWSTEEKRRIVELTHRAGASINTIAREHDVHPTVLSQWRKLYREGELAERSLGKDAEDSKPSIFLPVTVGRKNAMAGPSSCNLLEVVLPSGVVLRMETSTLDPQLLCAILAQLQR